MKTSTKVGLTLALVAGLLIPSLASALTRMPTARTLVKPTKQLLLQELRTRVPSIMCVPPYTLRNIKFTSKPASSTAGAVARDVTWRALHTPTSYGGHKGTCRINATIAPACGLDIKMTNFTLQSFWPTQPASR